MESPILWGGGGHGGRSDLLGGAGHSGKSDPQEGPWQIRSPREPQHKAQSPGGATAESLISRGATEETPIPWEGEHISVSLEPDGSKNIFG